MPTTFNVMFLGNTGGFRIDPIEGNQQVENGASLQGATAGSAADPLYGRVQEFAPGSTGFAAGTGNATAYDTNNDLVGGGETFTLDGGPEQTFDASTIYNNSTLTYTDGTTATISAVIFQDTDGNVYLAPEFSDNADQARLEAKPIQSIQLGTQPTNPYFSTGLTANRQSNDFVPCYTPGTRILTPKGYVAVDALGAGDLVCTVDNGPQPVEWIAQSRISAEKLDVAPNLRPIRLRQGHFGLQRDILVSPQHCVALGDRFVRATHLVSVPGGGARVARGVRQVSYFHLLCQRHEMLIVEGMQSESFYPGPQALRGMSRGARAEIGAKVPGLSLSGETQAVAAYGATVRPVLKRRDLRGVGHLDDLLAVA